MKDAAVTRLMDHRDGTGLHPHQKFRKKAFHFRSTKDEENTQKNERENEESEKK